MSVASLLRRTAARVAGPALVCAAACMAIAAPAGATTTTTTTTTTSSSSSTSTTTTTTTTVAPKPPSASTGAASSVSFDSATLAGTVNPNGVQTAYYFQYGESSGYGIQTSEASAGAGTANESVSASVSGLAASKTYHFRLVAVSTAGTTDGPDQTFTTAATPAPGVATESAKGATSDSATVTGIVAPHGVPTTYEFQYGKTAAYGLHTAGVSAGAGTANLAVSQTLGGLASSTTYHYRLIAISAGGTVAGSDRTFATAKPARASASTGAAGQITDTSAVLTGTVRPNGVATQYYFQYGKSTAYSNHTAVQSAGAGPAAVAVQAAVTGLTAATKYHYRLVVVGGGTTAGSDRSFTTTNVPLSLAATITPNRVGYGGAATVTGNLTGGGAAGRQVVLLARPFPYTTPFAQVGNAEVVSAAGTFTFAVTSLQQNTQYQVVTVGSPGASSPILTEGVAVRVTFGASVKRTRSGMRIRVFGTISPAAPDVIAYLQKFVRHRWVVSTRLGLSLAGPNALRYRRALRVRSGGRYRVVVRVTDGARLSRASRVLVLRRPRH